MIRTHLIAALILVGLLCAIAGAPRAETRMVVCLKGWPCLLRHVYETKTACDVDQVGEVRLFPSGTVIKCVRDSALSPRSIDEARK